MIFKKLSMCLIIAGVLCAGLPAAAQNGPPQKRIDPAALAEAIGKCPGLQGVDAVALAKSAQNCPGLNGTIKGLPCPDLTAGRIDPAAFALAASRCPALNPNLAGDASNCPALNGDLAAAWRNCPAFSQGGFKGPMGANVEKRIDRRMKRVARALERNKNSAETLIQAAREAGATPEQISDLQKMSQAFRKVFLSTVSPQQIVEGILQPGTPPSEEPQSIIITAPDGSSWLISPAEPEGPAASQGRAPRGMPPAIGKPMPPQGGPQGQFMPPPPPGPRGGFMPVPPPPAPQGQITPPAQGGFVPQPGPQGGFVPTPRPGQPAMIFMEEDTYMPLWPTKDEIGKDGVLKYLEKRAQRINSN